MSTFYLQYTYMNIHILGFRKSLGLSVYHPKFLAVYLDKPTPQSWWVVSLRSVGGLGHMPFSQPQLLRVLVIFGGKGKDLGKQLQDLTPIGIFSSKSNEN